MKKTLFLSAILGAALCSSAFGATAISVGENETRDISTELTAGTGIELTLANGATVTNTSKNYGSGSGDWGKQLTSVTLASGATATLDVSGTANSTGVGLVRSGLGEVGIDLNGGTLVKKGTGQTIVYHVTTGNSTGTIQVDNGRLRFDGTGYAFHGANANLVVNEHGSLYFNNLESTMKTLTSSGEVIVASSGGTKVNGTFTTNTGSTTTINNGTTLTVQGLNTTGGIIQGAGTLYVEAGTTKNNTTLDFDYISQTAGTKLSLKQAHGTLKAADTAIANAITLTNGSWAAAEWVNVEGSSYTFNGAISGGGNQVFSGESGLKEVALTFNGNLSGWNSAGDGYKGLRASSGMTLNVTIGGTLTGNDAVVANAFNADNGSKLNLTVDRDATFKGNLNITSLTVNAGKTADFATDKLNLNSLTLTLGNGSTVKFLSAKDWSKGEETARTSGNGYGTVVVSKTLGSVSDNGATVLVNGLAATLTDNVLTGTADSDTYYINNANEEVVINKSGAISLNSGTYAQTQKVEIGTAGAGAGAGTILTVDADTTLAAGTYLEVRENSTLNVNGTVTATDDTYNHGMWLHNGATVAIAEKGTLTVQGMTFKKGTIKATGDTQIGGTLGDPKKTTITGSDITVTSGNIREYNISGGSVTVNSNAVTTINSALSDTTDLTVNSGSTAKFTKATTVKTLSGTAGAVDVAADLTVVNGDVSLKSMNIAAGKTVTLGSVESHNHTLAVQSLTVNSAAESPTTLNANLDLTDTTTLTLNGALTMGCSVELGDGGIVLGGSVLEALELTTIGSSVTLFSDVESLTMGGDAVTGSVYASALFSNADLANTDDFKYIVTHNADNSVTLSVVPEPATATLSLLALAALAARRRRR